MNLYYRIRPLIPRRLQIQMRRWHLWCSRTQWRKRWPIWEEAGELPQGWPGWPGGKRFAVVLTHDVEYERGVAHCEALADLEEERGFRSAFGYIPLRYVTPESQLEALRTRGFEIMVHGLIHDGKLYRTRKIFEERKDKINGYLALWDARGFSSPAVHHNLAWISELEIDYDISTFDTDPFEPQRCGLGWIFPFWVQSPDLSGRGYIELPYTLTQDFSLFILTGARNNSAWCRKLDWIAEKGGMALIKTHPDYMTFDEEEQAFDGYPVKYYLDLLDYIQARYGDQAWVTLPSTVAQFWKSIDIPDEIARIPIPLHDTLCPSCQEYLNAGWLTQYKPHLVPVSYAGEALVQQSRLYP